MKYLHQCVNNESKGLWFSGVTKITESIFGDLFFVKETG